MKIDRELQLRILEALADIHPRTIHDADAFQALGDGDEDKFDANLLYLEEHGLIRSGLVRGGDGFMWNVSRTEITAKGIDFLLQDGGLSAILGVVTIRLHDETIKDLLEHRIMQSDLSPPDKRKWLDGLRSLPADATKQLVLKLVEKGLEQGPAAMSAIGTFLRSHGLF